MTKKRKLYYIPGSISLIGILIFLIWNKKEFTSSQYTILFLNVPKDEKPDNSYALVFSSFWIESEIKKKKQIRLTLDSDKTTNQKKLDLIKYEARKLKYTQDTATVITANFTDESTYGEFVQLLDICYTDDHKRFVPLKKSFVIFGEYPQRKIKEQSLMCCFGNDVITIPPHPKKLSFYQTIKNKLRPFINPESISLSGGWLFLVLISIYYKNRSKKNF